CSGPNATNDFLINIKEQPHTTDRKIRMIQSMFCLANFGLMDLGWLRFIVIWMESIDYQVPLVSKLKKKVRAPLSLY
ncbi:MAG: hypothetical protein OEQ53_17230, partial [Saprospiraceae bacterium]|nr:hypothetical protein [Saprospiraceae bacterium]